MIKTKFYRNDYKSSKLTLKQSSAQVSFGDISLTTTKGWKDIWKDSRKDGRKEGERPQFAKIIKLNFQMNKLGIKETLGFIKYSMK